MSERGRDRDPQENIEQIIGLARGPRGERGEAGGAGPGLSSSARYAIIFLFVFAMTLAGANLLFASSQVRHLRSAVLTQCHFDRDLGSVPVTVNPGTQRASKLAVTLVSDGRVAWYGLHCPGKLPPPTQSFVRWAAFYHLPTR